MTVKAASGRSWVIFDTCAQAPYYRDVHNVLALPVGAVIRYNYSEYLLSGEAKAAAAEWSQDSTPRRVDKVLLLYIQTRGFKHGDDLRETSKLTTDRVWVPIRLGRLIGLRVENAKYFFDIELSLYPGIPSDPTLFERLCTENPLHADDASQSWVTLAREIPEAKSFEESGSVDNWHKTVSYLQNNTQFQQDSFWRVASARELPANLPAKPLGHTEVELDAFGVALGYPLLQREQLALTIENYEPQSATAKSEHAGRAAERFISTDCDSDLVRVTPPNPTLRPYYSRTLRIRAGAEALIQEAFHQVRLQTNPQVDEWPIGPAFTLTLKVRRSIRELLFGSLAGIAGACALFWANKFPGSNPSGEVLALSVVIAGVGVALVCASSYLLYRQLSFKS